ncbi:MAG TPA: GAF domain-containing protein [Candidatus Bathyarchaeia archaeon]|nr:GAF domain-containing protein [Candidatus Bathyarchaeia archaeon]
MAKKKSNRLLTISPDQELEVLRKVVEASSADLELSKTLKEIVKIVDELTTADSVFIYLYDKGKKNLTLMASKIPHQKELGAVKIRTGEGITGWVAQENKPVAIGENAYQDKRFKGFDVLPEDKYEAFLSVPIIYKGKVSGVINVQHKKPHEYACETINLLEMISKQVGGVIEHAVLYEETRIKANQFDSLVKVSQSITSESYLDEILGLIVLVTAEMLNSKICSIMLVDGKKGDELSIRATQSLSAEYKTKPNLKINQSLLGDVVRTRKPVMVEDVRQDKRYVHRDLAVKENLSSMVAVPMIVKKKVIGLLNVYTKEAHQFSQEEVDMIQMIANQAAVAVENTNLVSEAMKAKEALETRKLVERAKGILMRMHNLDEDTAYRMIHKKSMDTCKSMREIAESIVLIEEMGR